MQNLHKCYLFFWQRMLHTVSTPPQVLSKAAGMISGQETGGAIIIEANTGAWTNGRVE